MCRGNVFETTVPNNKTAQSPAVYTRPQNMLFLFPLFIKQTFFFYFQHYMYLLFPPLLQSDYFPI